MAQAKATGGSTTARSSGGACTRPLCEVWGVLNVTPDSFSDGGQFDVPSKAVGKGLEMWRQGASVIDVGGESTRPPGQTYGAVVPMVDAQQECDRVLPVVQRLCAEGVRVSVDTTKAQVARAACEAGASIINDVGCGGNADLLDVVAGAGATLVLMHNRGRGEREGDTARYADVCVDSLTEVREAVSRAEAAGVARERIWIDPGLGFAKRAEDSGRLLARLSDYVATGLPVLVGASRKSFLAAIAGAPDSAPKERLAASLVAACSAQSQGARAVRVHDVPETLQALQAARWLSEQGAAP